jgi:plastocyanin
MYRPRMGARISFVLVSLLAACGGDDGGNNDGMNMIDAPAASIAEVTPCAGETVTITTQASKFDMPAVTITQGQVVKFVSTPTHPIGAIAPTDAILAVPENQTKCFRFTAPGTFKFKCTFHGYAGMITVN